MSPDKYQQNAPVKEREHYQDLQKKQSKHELTIKIDCVFCKTLDNAIPEIFPKSLCFVQFRVINHLISIAQ